MFRKILCVLFALVILSLPLLSLGEEPLVPGYNFDLFFYVNAEEFPASLRARARGYASLFNSLELKGTLVVNPDTQVLELNVSVIPLSDPSAALSFRVFGPPSHLCMTSPLLGEEVILFNNAALMEFALKAYHQYNTLLQYPVLFYPYVTRLAFSGLGEAWKRLVGTPGESCEVSYQTLSDVAEAWSELLVSDPALSVWVSAVSEATGLYDEVRMEFDALPDYLLTQVAEGGSLSVSVQPGEEVWTSPSGSRLFISSSTEASASWTLTLPETRGGFVPSAGLSVISRGESLGLDFYAEYKPADGGASLVSLFVSADGIPVSWPSSGTFTADITVAGRLLPDYSVSLQGSSDSEGNISLALLKPFSSEMKNSSEILRIFGTVLPMEPQPAPGWNPYLINRYLNVFSVNESSLGEFVRRVQRPLLEGLLNFIAAVPASACQAFMDDLTDTGILNTLLSN